MTAEIYQILNIVLLTMILMVGFALLLFNIIEQINVWRMKRAARRYAAKMRHGDTDANS